MQIVLKVWCSNPDHYLGFDYAIVEADDAFLNGSLRRINVLREQNILDPSLYEMYYWDFSAEYVDLSVDRPPQADGTKSKHSEFEESLDALEVDVREAVVATAHCNIPEGRIQAVECAQMIVRESGIAFNALLKHSDIYLTTAGISMQLIESALASASQ